jgi:hypothetical protein
MIDNVKPEIASMVNQKQIQKGLFTTLECIIQMKQHLKESLTYNDSRCLQARDRVSYQKRDG